MTLTAKKLLEQNPHLTATDLRSAQKALHTLRQLKNSPPKEYDLADPHSNPVRRVSRPMSFRLEMPHT